MTDLTSAGGDGDPLEALAREVDSIDAALLALIVQRLGLGDRISQLKPPVAGLPLQPGREIAVLRRLMAAASPGLLEPEIVVEIWRTLLAAATRRQRVIDVYVGGGRGDPTRLFDLARRHFGARARIQHVGEPQATLLRVLEAPERSVAVTPWPAAPGVGAWWPALSENRFRNIHLIAGLPQLGNAEETPEACVLAASAPDEAGEDISLLLAFDPHHRVVRALKDAGLNGREIARAEPRVLLRIDGFVGVDDPRAASLTRLGLESVRVLGAYARI
jgi:chorismate mutase / prephenate dehydratase